jgi:hypothetical protein
MKHLVMAFLGFILVMSSLWGGAYVMETADSHWWGLFPTFLTAIFGFMAGSVLIIHNMVEYTSNKTWR